MPRPVLLAVDADPDVLPAVERDRRKQYSDRYRVMCAECGPDPPDRNLYPVLDDLLDQWSASYRPPFEGIRVIGTRWSPRCYEVREFLARHQIPYQWLDIESADAKTIRASIGDGQPALPVVILADGTTLADPSLGDLADRVGLRTRSQTKFFDLVIVG